MSESIDHVILTRFNLPSIGAESIIRAKEGWLRNRVQLFETYCLPSVRAQTLQNFDWIIYLDPESPQWLKDKMIQLNKPFLFTVIYRSQVSDSERLDDIKAVSGAAGSVLITTNLDNDDGLATDFVERLQREPAQADRTALYFGNGLIRQGSTLYLNRDAANAFCSVRESWEAPVTCWADWHNRLGLTMPVREVGGPAAWLQVVHGTNVSNRVRGRLVAAGPYEDKFGPLLEGVKDPGRGTLLRERVLERPYRTAREGARYVAKSVIIRAFGTSGLDRVKSLSKTTASSITQ
jgi:hypothetical protein